MHNEVDARDPPAETLELELAREVCQEHVLAGRSVRAIGYMPDCPNDVLYALLDEPGVVAWVHLTWHPEETANFPFCRVYVDWRTFLAEAPRAGG